MATQQQIDLGAQALKNFVESIDGWEADFVPWGTYEGGSKLVIDAWDTGNPPSVTSCGTALCDSISNAGYGGSVTEQQCVQAAGAVLAAAGRLKARMT